MATRQMPDQHQLELYAVEASLNEHRPAIAAIRRDADRVRGGRVGGVINLPTTDAAMRALALAAEAEMAAMRRDGYTLADINPLAPPTTTPAFTRLHNAITKAAQTERFRRR